METLFTMPATRQPIPYPAYESGMGSTFVWETDDQAADDSEALWQRAVRLQRLLDRVGGLA